MRTTLQHPTWQRLLVLFGLVLAVAGGRGLLGGLDDQDRYGPARVVRAGRLADIGGRHLYLECQGTEHLKPTEPTRVAMVGRSGTGRPAGTLRAWRR